MNARLWWVCWIRVVTWASATILISHRHEYQPTYEKLYENQAHRPANRCGRDGCNCATNASRLKALITTKIEGRARLEERHMDQNALEHWKTALASAEENKVITFENVNERPIDMVMVVLINSDGDFREWLASLIVGEHAAEFKHFQARWGVCRIRGTGLVRSKRTCAA